PRAPARALSVARGGRDRADPCEPAAAPCDPRRPEGAPVNAGTSTTAGHRIGLRWSVTRVSYQRPPPDRTDRTGRALFRLAVIAGLLLAWILPELVARIGGGW